MHQHALIVESEMNNEFRIALHSTARSYPSATNRVIKLQFVERLYVVRPVKIPFAPGELDRLNLTFGVRENDFLVIQQISIFNEIIFETGSLHPSPTTPTSHHDREPYSCWRSCV